MANKYAGLLLGLYFEGPGLFGSNLSSTLSFTSPAQLTKTTSKGLLSATLSFTGPTNLNNVVSKGISAGLSFTGSFTKLIKKSLEAAGLSFVGGLIAAGQKFLQALTATLSFSGSMSKVTSTKLSSSLSFSGSMVKKIYTGLAASLSFTGNMFISAFFRKALTATLSFSGVIRKLTNKAFSGSLGFLGGFAQLKLPRFISFVATLPSSGKLTNIRWYTGTFKFKSVGVIRAVSRAIANMITQKQGTQ